MSEVLHPAQMLFTEKHPLTSVLNLKFHPTIDHVLPVSLDAPEIFAAADGQWVHTGFNTLLLDTVMGASVLGELDRPQPIATVKLTVNHLRQAKVGEAVICRAKYQGVENEIAYVHGEFRTVEDDRLLSTAIGTFMIGTANKPLDSKK